MKRIILGVCMVLALSVGVYGAEAMTHVADYNMGANATGAGLRMYTMAANRLTGVEACTTDLIDGQRFVEMALFTRRGTDASCDSARLHIYRDRSFNGSDWVLVDSIAYAGKVADTLGVIHDWTTAKPGIYYRWRFQAYNAAAGDSVFLWEARWILQQK